MIKLHQCAESRKVTMKMSLMQLKATKAQPNLPTMKIHRMLLRQMMTQWIDNRSVALVLHSKK